MRKIIQSTLRRAGLWVYRLPPHGTNPLSDMKRRFPVESFDCLFDIGANLGQSATEMRKFFPTAKIHCFEPFPYIFKLLKENTKNLDLNYHLTGLGKETKQLTVGFTKSTKYLGTNSLIREPASITAELDQSTVDLTTLDKFCHREEISNIDYLKIDTEGMDLDVLKGASELLRSKKIKVIQLEVSMSRFNTDHISMSDASDFLQLFEYELFGIYDQALEWKLRRSTLRRANLVFVSLDLGKIVPTTA